MPRHQHLRRLCKRWENCLKARFWSMVCAGPAHGCPPPIRRAGQFKQPPSTPQPPLLGLPHGLQAEANPENGHAPAGGNRVLVQRRPIGVAVLVTPWNFPAAMATRKIGPALAAGCSVVLKPAAATPLTALAIAGHLRRAGAPPGVVNVVPTRHSGPVVRAMLDHTEVRKVSFTGSTEVGKVLLRQAADRVLGASMELGGNAPFLVFADADLDEAVAGAMVAKMRNGGEACTAANRFLVHASVADAFARRLADAMRRLRVGPGLEPGTEVGPLIDERARDGMQDVVDEAVAAGATVLTGGSVPPGPGWFYPPTVLAGVPADAPVLRREIFGPIAPVTPFDTADEAIALANRCETGLAGYVYTRDLALGLRVAERERKHGGSLAHIRIAIGSGQQRAVRGGPVERHGHFAAAGKRILQAFEHVVLKRGIALGDQVDDRGEHR